jgi:hypothetical protein
VLAALWPVGRLAGDRHALGESDRERLQLTHLATELKTLGTKAFMRVLRRRY